MTSSATQFNFYLLSLIKKGINFQEVISIVEKKDLFNAKDGKNNTLLHYAAQNGNIKVAKHLIDSGSNIDEQNTFGETALMLAVTNKHVSVAEVLVDAGASIYIRNNHDENVLSIILEKDFLTKENKRRLCLKILQIGCLKDQENIAKKLFDADWPLDAIVELGDAELTKIILQRGYTAKTNINKVNRFGQTSLHIAVRNVDVENVKLLLEYGANVNAVNTSKLTPLSYIYNEKKNDNYNSDDDYDDTDEESEDKYNTSEKKCQKEKEDNVPEHSKEKLDTLKLLLNCTSKEDINKHQISNILKYGNKEAIKLLVQSNIDPMSSTNSSYKNLALRILAENENHDVMKQLHDRSFDVNVVDLWNNTPLINAVKSNNPSSLDFLLKRGANVDYKDEYEMTALLYAAEYYSKRDKSYKECVQVLLEHGANLNRRHVDNYSIFKIILMKESFALSEIVFAHIALQEAKGTTITRFIQSQMVKHDQFKNDFESSKHQLSMKVYQSITLLDLLTATDVKLERYIRNEELAKKLKNFNSNYYFNTILQRRMMEAEETIILKRAAACAICQIMESSYDRFPLIADNIISYLDLADMKNLIDALVEK